MQMHMQLLRRETPNPPPGTARPQILNPGSPEPNQSNELLWIHLSKLNPLQLTPMLRHYVKLKADHPKRVQLCRLGDFFKCFFEDAIELSRVLGVTITGKEGGEAIGRVPIEGFTPRALLRHSEALYVKFVITPTQVTLLTPTNTIFCT